MTECESSSANHYQLAIKMFVSAVGTLKQQTRAYYHRLVLCGLPCPRCQRTNLFMLREGRFRCQDCGQASDPTITFQRCPTCDGKPALAFRRYHCRDCGGEVVSRFLFDAVVYNAEYFREKMAQSRERRHEQHLQAREDQAVRAWQRSASVVGDQAIDLEQSVGLVDALNALVAGTPPETLTWVREAFDLAAYEQHILSAIGFGENWNLVGIRALRPPKDRLEVVRLFIACLFLEHAGLVTLTQEQDIIWVRRCEIN